MTPDADHLRAFVAVLPNAALAGALARFQAALAAAPFGNAVRWTKPGQLHLTLRFIARLPVNQLEQTIRLLSDACRDVPPFQLQFDSLGAFPDAKRPRVIWLGCNGQIESILTLQRRVADSLSFLEDESNSSRFHPHLTLGRVRPDARRTADLADWLRTFPVPRFEPWQINTVHLIRSELGSQGATHTTMAELPLKASALLPPVTQ